MSFYQTYRPKRIAELDLVSVRDALQSSLATGTVSHAYLFVGPRGSGKTSAARILAQVVNCQANAERTESLSEPCGECEACLGIGRGGSVDVIEIDAASNGLVDDIRDLRDKVRLAPVQLTKKVYIIDEVHMVSTAGFNALLKTLEEPPSHALFILCTTELHKVPETIISRCARVNFTKATTDELVESLMKAVKGEKLEIEKDLLEEIAEATDGSFREGHKILEQMSAFGKKINEEILAKVLGIAGRHSVKKLLDAALDGESDKVLKIFEEMEKTGTKANLLASSLLTLAKTEMEERIKKGERPIPVVKIIDKLIEAADKIKISPLPLLPLEIALLSASLDREEGPRPKAQMPAQQSETEKDSVIKASAESLIRKENIEEKINTLVQPQVEPFVSLEQIKTGWGAFLSTMAESNGSLAGMLRLVSPVDVQGKSLTISVTSRFQQDMLEREVKRKLIEEQMAKVWGPITFKCILVDKVIRTQPMQEDENLASPKEDRIGSLGVMDAAEKIFGV